MSEISNPYGGLGRVHSSFRCASRRPEGTENSFDFLIRKDHLEASKLSDVYSVMSAETRRATPSPLRSATIERKLTENRVSRVQGPRLGPICGQKVHFRFCLGAWSK